MPKAGDKYIVEIDAVLGSLIGKPFSESEEYLRGSARFYKIKGLDSFVLNEYEISKLKKYEPKEETTRFDKVELQVGDEVCDRNDMIWVITKIDYSHNTKTMSGIDATGRTHFGFLDNLVATGRHFDTIADTLKSLQHEE